MDTEIIIDIYSVLIKVYSVLDDAAKTTLVQNLIVSYVIWVIIKKTAKRHFETIEAALDRIAKALERHEQRIENLESKITTFSQGVKK